MNGLQVGMHYIDILVIHCITPVRYMSTAVSIRLPDKMADDLEELASSIDRSKTYVIKKAIEVYLEEYSDYLIALERLRDKDDEIITAEDMRDRLGL